MRAQGFSLSGRHYCRIENDMAYCISFDMPSGLVYVTAYIMPLFVPSECRYYTYGNRLNAISGIDLPVINAQSAQSPLDAWAQTLVGYIDGKILPFFREVNTPGKLVAYMDACQNTSTAYISCHRVYAWRLKMYTFLYTGNDAKLSDTFAHFRNALDGAAFLSGGVCQQYRDEISNAEMLAANGADAVKAYCLQTISASKQRLKQ